MDLRQPLGDLRGAVGALNSVGNVFMESRRLSEAFALYVRATLLCQLG